MKNLEFSLPAGLVEALGWTLIHAIWQIAALALLLMLTFQVLRRGKPELRYTVALGTMLLIPFVSLLTFWLSFRSFSVAAIGPAPGAEVLLSQAVIEPDRAGILDLLRSFFQEHLRSIVSLWALGVLLLSMRFAGCLWYLGRLRKGAVAVGAGWKGRLDLLCIRAGVNRGVGLAESALVQVPVLIGHLKPLILVPAGMLTAIPPDQIEAILVHELAHVRRNDFLVNLLQNLLETVYFFHPGFWWINRMVRRERELCCDELATCSGCDPLTLAQALSELGEWSLSGSRQPALAFGAKGEESLLDRIRHLLGQEPPRQLSLVPAGMLTGILCLCLLFTVSDKAFSSAASADEKDEEEGVETVISALEDKFLDGGSIEILRGVWERINRDSVPAAPAPGRLFVPAPDSVPVHPHSVPRLELSEPPPPPALSPAPQLGHMGVVPPVPDINLAPVNIELNLTPLPEIPPLPPIIDSSAQRALHKFSWHRDSIPDLSIRLNGKDFQIDEEDFKHAMEEFGKRMGEWGAEFGKSMEAWGKANAPRFKQYEEQMKAWERENAPKLKEYEERMKAWEKENASKLKEYEERMKEWQKAAEEQREAWEKRAEQWKKENESRQKEQERRIEERKEIRSDSL